MGSSGKVVNLVVGKEVTTIGSQFQKSYIGTPTAKLSLTLEEGSKLSSIGNDAFKDNTFFVSIDLSNAAQDMTLGTSAFNGVSNLSVFKTGTGKLTLNKESLANLKQCKEFYHNCSSIEMGSSFAYNVVFTNPSTAWTHTVTASISSITYNPTVNWASWGGWYNIKGSGSYLISSINGNQTAQAMNPSGGSAKQTVSNVVYNPTYQIQNYTHPLLNLGSSVGCSVIIGENTKSIAANLFSSGTRYTIQSALASTVTSPAFTATASIAARSITYYARYNNNAAVNNATVSVPAGSRAFTAAAVSGLTYTPEQDIIAFNSGINIVKLTTTGDLQSIGMYAFGLEDKTCNSTGSVSVSNPDTTLPASIGASFYGYCGTTSSPYLTGWRTATHIQSGNAVTVTDTVVKTTFSTTVQLTDIKNVTQVGVSTNVQNGKLKTVSLGTVSSACTVGYGAFSFNPNLERIVVGSGINTIEADAFHGVNTSSTAYILGKASNTFKPDSNNGLTAGGHSSLGNIVYLADAKDLGWYIAHYQVGDAVTAYLFEQIDGSYIINIVGSGATYDTYTESNTPGWHADYKHKVSQVIVDDTVTSIGPYLFYGHTALTSVQFGTGLTSIGAHAFGNCTGLDSFTVPATLTSVGERILEGAAVKTVYYNANTEDAYHSMSGCDAEEIILGANVTKIGDGTLGDISTFFVEAGEALK